MINLAVSQKFIVRSVLSSLVLSSSLFVSSFAQAKDESVEQQLRFKEGDENGNEIKALKTELLVMRAEKKALAQLEMLLRKHKGTRLEPELLSRKAELFMRRARTERFFEIHKTSEQILSSAPTLVKDASEAKEIRRAIGIYEQIQREFPRYPSMDLVIFNNAYAYQQLGNDKAAEQLYVRLTTQHQDSVLVPDSYLAIGELNYNRKSFSTALTNFKKVRAYPQARVYPYSMYKAGWCYYNMQDASAGLRELEDVVKFGRQVAAQNLDSKLDLRNEALRDMALFFNDVMPAEKAVAYLRGQAGDLDPAPVIMRLVELYKRHSKYKEIEVVLKDVLKALDGTPIIAKAHEELIWNYENDKRRPAAVKQMADFDAYCNKEIKKSNGKTPECLDKILTTSKRLASKWHATWKKKSAEPELLNSAEKAYELYISHATIDKDADLPMTRRQYADLLFQQNKFRQASEQYALIRPVQGKQNDAKLIEDASYASIVSLEKAVNDKWNDQDEARFRELVAFYLKNSPKAPYALDLEFKRAFIAYEKKRYDEAADDFKKIGWGPTASGTQEKVVKAQDFYLDILNIKKDYKTLKEASSALLQKNQSSERITAITKIYREAYFAEIQKTEEDGKLKEAIDAYKKFALENKSSELSGKAWWNSSQLQFKIGDAEGGANTCHQMIKLFPDSPKGQDCLTKAASTFESLGRLDLAGNVLTDLATLDTKQASKWKELAADFFALSGGRQKAREMYMKIADGVSQERQQLLFQKTYELAKIDLDKKSMNQVLSRLTGLGVEPYSSESTVEKAEEYLRQGDLTEAFNSSKRIIARENLPKNLLARARFVQAQVLEDEFMKQSVKSKLDRVATVLALKTEKLEKAQKAYQSTIAYGDPETSVKALRKLAACYLHYSTSLRTLQISDTVSEADLQAFENEMEKLVVPMEDKGVDSLAQALEAAKKFHMHDGTIAEIQNELTKVNHGKQMVDRGPATTPRMYVPKFDSLALTSTEGF